MEEDHRSNFRSEENSAQKRKREEEEVELDLPRMKEKPVEKTKRSNEQIIEFSNMEHDNLDNHPFSEETSAQKQKQEEEDVKLDLPRTKEKPEEKKKTSNEEIDALSNVDFDNHANHHFSEEKSAQKRKLEKNDVELDLFEINEKQVEKKKRSNEEINESLDMEHDNWDNFYFSEEKSPQKRKQAEGVEFDFPVTNENQVERKKRSYEEIHDILVDNIQCSVSSGKVCKQLDNTNLKLSKFVINDSCHMNWSREPSDLENDKRANFLFSEEKAEKLKQEVQERKQKAQKRKQEDKMPEQEDKKRKQEDKIRKQEVEKKETEKRKRAAQKREQQLKQKAQTGMWLAKQLVQDQRQEAQKRKQEENDLNTDLPRTSEGTSENKKRSNEIIFGRFTVCTQSLSLNISNCESSIFVNNDSFYIDITWPSESSENSKDDYNDAAKYGSDDFSENNEDEPDGWCENESNEANNYQAGDYFENNEGKQPDGRCEDEFDEVIEYEPVSFSENNEDEPDGRHEDESNDADKYKAGVYFENEEGKLYESGEDESTDIK